VSQFKILSFRPQGEILGLSKIKVLRFLTFVRNDIKGYYVTQSLGADLSRMSAQRTSVMPGDACRSFSGFMITPQRILHLDFFSADEVLTSFKLLK